MSAASAHGKVITTRRIAAVSEDLECGLRTFVAASIVSLPSWTLEGKSA
jgi:hypothetical protein